MFSCGDAAHAHPGHAGAWAPCPVLSCLRPSKLHEITSHPPPHTHNSFKACIETVAFVDATPHQRVAVGVGAAVVLRARRILPGRQAGAPRLGVIFSMAECYQCCQVCEHDRHPPRLGMRPAGARPRPLQVVHRETEVKRIERAGGPAVGSHKLPLPRSWGLVEPTEHL